MVSPGDGSVLVQRMYLKFETWVILFTLHCLCLSEETVQTTGPFYSVFIPGQIKTTQREVELF